MQIRFFNYVIAILVAVLFHGAALAAAPHASRNDAVAFVKKAIAYLKQNGKDKALQDFNIPNGPFIDGELYIVVLDMKGVLLADGTKPRLVGKSLLDIKDVNGKPFVREEVDLARSKGQGWVDFEWVNPVTKTMEQRSTYFERVGDLIVLTGVYHQR